LNELLAVNAIGMENMMKETKWQRAERYAKRLLENLCSNGGSIDDFSKEWVAKVAFRAGVEAGRNEMRKHMKSKFIEACESVFEHGREMMDKDIPANRELWNGYGEGALRCQELAENKKSTNDG
jgi:hypothetical protein